MGDRASDAACLSRLHVLMLSGLNLRLGLRLSLRLVRLRMADERRKKKQQQTARTGVSTRAIEKSVKQKAALADAPLTLACPSSSLGIRLGSWVG